MTHRLWVIAYYEFSNFQILIRNQIAASDTSKSEPLWRFGDDVIMMNHFYDSPLWLIIIYNVLLYNSFVLIEGSRFLIG